MTRVEFYARLDVWFSEGPTETADSEPIAAGRRTWLQSYVEARLLLLG